MKKKILVILVCMLMMLVTSLVVAGQTIEMNKQEKVLPKDILPDKGCEIPVSYQFLEECNVDAEQYVWDEKNQKWIDADTHDEAQDIPTCSDVIFKIVIHNNGNEPLLDIVVKDTFGDSLKFISAEPEPDYIDDSYPPWWILWWDFYEPLNPCETIEVYITAHEEGPECSYDYSFVEVYAFGEGSSCQDGDFVYIHATPKSRILNSLILDILQCHPNLFPLLQKLLLLRLGL